MRLGLLVFVTILANSASAHPGGWDANGGHTARATGIYHCHDHPCLSNTKLENQQWFEKKQFSKTYDRSQWPHWLDPDKNCRDVSQDVLMRDVTANLELARNRCFVVSGKWRDPYTNQLISNKKLIEIDHVVPLFWAHTHGGASWSHSQKAAFANDLDNLLAVSRTANQDKSASGPIEWLPPNSDFRCSYLDIWSVVLRKYPALAFTNEEKAYFDEQLNRCR